jgi:DNA-binding CsgD family transcriptional regulator
MPTIQTITFNGDYEAQGFLRQFVVFAQKLDIAVDHLNVPDLPVPGDVRRMLLPIGNPGHPDALVVFDAQPWGVFHLLEDLQSVARSRTAVVTRPVHPIVSDCVASYHLANTFSPRHEELTTDELSLLVGAALSGTRTYQWRSGLTYMELRVTRLLLVGETTRSIASRLSISSKTVNAHMSNILAKTGTENRTHYLTLLRAPVLAPVEAVA